MVILDRKQQFSKSPEASSFTSEAKRIIVIYYCDLTYVRNEITFLPKPFSKWYIQLFIHN